MTKQQKYLLAGGVVAAGLAYWWFTNNQSSAAASQIVSQPTAPTSVPITTGASAAPVGTSTNAAGQDITELNALLAWTNQTKNPSLYAQMINALTPSQLDSLYNILTTDWEGSGQPTAAQTAFWNSLVAQYPFLVKGGAGCTNFNCT